jgi:hypothetical protein
VVVDIRGDKALFMIPDIGMMTQIKFKNLPQLDEEIPRLQNKNFKPVSQNRKK